MNIDKITPTLFKVNNRNTCTRCEIYSKLTPCSKVSIVNFEHVIAGWDLNECILNVTVLIVD